MRVLIIDNSIDVSESISLCLQLRWPDAYIALASEGDKGFEFFQSKEFDIVILDLNLPDLNGMEVLMRIRGVSDIPIIIVTARGSENDQITALEMGADDYIVKPFKPRDLVARVNAKLRRSTGKKVVKDDPESVKSGKINMNISTNKVSINDHNIKLSPIEARILYVLIKNSDKTVSINQLLDDIWGERKTSNSLVVRTYIRRLRLRIGDTPPQIIVTQQREGYRFVTPK